MARLMFGAMADETLLADMQIAPQRLRAMGFEWQTPTLEAALHACLQKDADGES
jgi:NAD dependent epimerase/dehydratase family enzyme